MNVNAATGTIEKMSHFPVKYCIECKRPYEMSRPNNNGPKRSSKPVYYPNYPTIGLERVVCNNCKGENK